MNPPNVLNVFKGPDALVQFFDPDRSPPLPLVELPDALNPLRRDGVRIFAKMLTQLPAQNVKSLPALRMLRNERDAHRQKIVEASSGSTVLSLGMISRALWDHEDVHAFVTNKKHPDSLKLLRFFGLNVNLYGGLAQQEPYDPKGIMSRLKETAERDPGVCYPGQYHNDHNWKSHEQWTGAQIWKQLPEITVFCSTIGTGGCAVGTGTYLKSRNPSVKVIGVCNVFGDPTPGPRHFPNFESSPFPWRETIDAFEDVSSVDSYRTSMKLSRYGIIAGPSSGEALHGLLAYLQRMKADGRLPELADPSTGEVSCAFICADLPYQYMDMYYKKLADEEFPPIQNENLLHCDQDAYDERWFLQPNEAASHLLSHNSMLTNAFCSVPSPCLCKWQSSSPVSTSSSVSSVISDSSSSNSVESSPSIFSVPECSTSKSFTFPEITVLDLRPRDIYAASHLCGSRNVPLPPAQKDFFGDARALEQRWAEMKEAVEREDWIWADGRSILVLCADGDSGRMATAMLRAKGCEAMCVEGGYPAMFEYLDGYER
ncbi:tryptophan synthase beta subunit-like PLP-dependent enzyme [Melanomma pulvis-pyrius CBS 109.77]|uniref:Tryptophan synthase beta subunit-like PLP-dependent enzyme n=1 Tax=Melanomma pulvis-pyrius CBS 109.77 TaxID=1314802 RepID=A0A6A6X9U1_9PLEO|nr:tryptophan synthase beta subunit-like PLP-dependent enzyme [Melanomma pulvis-pyrius CBS 109.77]